MKTVLLVATALACAFPSGAQITASVRRFPTGAEELRIRNNSSLELVAYVISAKHLSHEALEKYVPMLVYFDTIDSETGPLAPKEERQVMLSGTRFHGRVFEEPLLTAGIFADGTTTGEPALLNRLILRRSNLLQAVETALEIVSDAGRRNIPREQLIDQFRRMADSVRHWYLPPEQQVGLSIYQPIIGKLVNLPEEPYGSPFPPASFVKSETAMLNQQRVRLLASQPSLSEAAYLAK